MNINELIKRWEPTGLLEGMTKKKDMAQLSQLLENCAKYLIVTQKKGKITTEICGVMLPCVRRIYGMDNYVVFDFKFLQEVLEHCLSNMSKAAKLHDIEDAEAEATSLACDYFVSEQKEKNARKDLIKALAKPARTLQIDK